MLKCVQKWVEANKVRRQSLPWYVVLQIVVFGHVEIGSY